LHRKYDSKQITRGSHTVSMFFNHSACILHSGNRIYIHRSKSSLHARTCMWVG
jgi:hypothetical protein